MSPEEIVSSGNNDGREYPKRPVASVAACVFKDNKVLLIKRATPPSLGKWSVPGGVIELGETFEETAKRELDEECCIEIEVGKVFTVENATFLDEKDRIQFHYIITYLIAFHAGGEARPGMEALDVRWATRGELDNLDMNPVVRKNMSDAFDIVYPGD
jgi:8-oxo-dGTP diphosphatase